MRFAINTCTSSTKAGDNTTDAGTGFLAPVVPGVTLLSRGSYLKSFILIEVIFSIEAEVAAGRMRAT